MFDARGVEMWCIDGIISLKLQFKSLLVVGRGGVLMCMTSFALKKQTIWKIKFQKCCSFRNLLNVVDGF